MTENPSFSDILIRIKDQNLPKRETRYSKLFLNYNPFPKSGTANIKTPYEQFKYLTPVNEDLSKDIEEYLVATLFADTYNAKDKYMGATIIGNYGSGKTQMLMYVKYLLDLIAVDKEYHQKPYVIYIDNPGVRLSELIGKIISEVGEENFKKFLWNKIILELEANYRNKLDRDFNLDSGLFGATSDPWNKDNKINYKKFIDAWLKNLSNKSIRKTFFENIDDLILSILNSYSKDKIVAVYFHRILVEDFGISSSWDLIIKGDIKQLTGKEADIIRFIIGLLYDEGFSHVYVMVDEFEDITRGRLSKSQVDNYLYSLRTLIDKERNWTIVFAMTQEAFMSLEESSPPLADRITSRKILIKDLTPSEAEALAHNYLKMARVEGYNGNDLTPFTLDSIAELNQRLRGNSRTFLSNCFKLIELAVEKELLEITKDIISNEVEQIQ